MVLGVDDGDVSTTVCLMPLNYMPQNGYSGKIVMYIYRNKKGLYILKLLRNFSETELYFKGSEAQLN